ncbi:hypothetical protein KQI84_11910 [bacterium]|nr:hypothetical protein [bacterium]
MNIRRAFAVSMIAGVCGAAAAESANEVAARDEMNTMAQQMVLVSVDTTYFTTLENLNDLSIEPGDPDDHFDWINDKGGALVIDMAEGRFEASRVDLVNRPSSLQWQGPYITYQQGRVDGVMSDYDEGTPLDPWGTPYYFYSPVGLIAPKQSAVVLQDYQDDFDMYTIVSFGADGIMSGDDLFHQFYGSVASPTISSVRIGPATTRAANYVASIKGYYFGASQGSGSVLIDGAPPFAVASWSSSLIEVELESLPATGATFGVQTDGGASLSFTGYLNEGATSVRDWELY